MIRFAEAHSSGTTRVQAYLASLTVRQDTALTKKLGQLCQELVQIALEFQRAGAEPLELWVCADHDRETEQQSSFTLSSIHPNLIRVRKDGTREVYAIHVAISFLNPGSLELLRAERVTYQRRLVSLFLEQWKAAVEASGDSALLPIMERTYAWAYHVPAQLYG